VLKVPVGELLQLLVKEPVGISCFRLRSSAQDFVEGDEIAEMGQTEVDQALLCDVQRTLSDEDA
jgi:hypothetical protein